MSGLRQGHFEPRIGQTPKPNHRHLPVWAMGGWTAVIRVQYV
jgi:hypothetical protein